MTARPAVDFQFDGRLALDLTWTLRHRAVRPTELLRAPEDLRSWLHAAGLPAPDRPAAGVLAEARRLREAVHRAAEAVIDGRSVGEEDRILINRWAAEPPPAPVLGADGRRHLTAVAGREVAAALSAIARDAIDLLTAGDGRLRRCSGPRCSLLFRDDSRPGTRRWCATARCGNKVNTQAYRRRRQQRPDPSDEATPAP